MVLAFNEWYCMHDAYVLVARLRFHLRYWYIYQLKCHRKYSCMHTAWRYILHVTLCWPLTRKSATFNFWGNCRPRVPLSTWKVPEGLVYDVKAGSGLGTRLQGQLDQEYMCHLIISYTSGWLEIIIIIRLSVCAVHTCICSKSALNFCFDTLHYVLGYSCCPRH